MTLKGTLRGNVIELESTPSELQGQIVYVSIEPAGANIKELLEFIANFKIEPDAIEEFERNIEEGKRPIKYEGIFDKEVD